MSRLAVIAIGGNSITKQGQVGTIKEQFDNAAETAEHIAGMVTRGWDVVLTHGNGPQVGNVLMRVELASPHIYALPLDTCDSDTQGGMGYMLQQVLGNTLRARGINKPVATLITQVLVDENDPAFQNPTKPIGPFFSQAEAERRQDERGWHVKEDVGRGWRRVVPSPQPLELIEEEAIRRCLQNGIILIACGGGGIPVARRGNQLHGVEAVIDKDRASALLAKRVNADLFLISTAVEKVLLNFKKPNETPIDRMTLPEARNHLSAGQFPPGSMGPKIEAAIDYLQHGGQRVIITTPEKLIEALDGKTGTHIVPQ
ncbi:MAG: carbamate kinase [Acidobacteriia bacterium]|nr:carbamate kinase [Terriglobia bacterium]